MRFVVFIVATLFMISIFLIDDEKLSKKAKFIITAVIAIFAIFAYSFESFTQSKAKDLNELSTAFKQGKTLICSDGKSQTQVNLQNFEFSFATSSFIAKRDALNEFKNKTFNAKDCTIK